MSNMLILMEETLGAFVRRTREDKGWTLDYMGRLIGRPQTWVSNLEVGRKKNLPEPEELRALARVLDVSVDDMLTAAGYLKASDRQRDVANPFERTDPRWRVVEALKQLDLGNDRHRFIVESAQLVVGMTEQNYPYNTTPSPEVPARSENVDVMS